MGQIQKRNLVILTDDVDKTEEIIGEKIKTILYIEHVNYIKIIDCCFTINTDPTNVTVAFINDIKNLSHTLLINLIKLVSDEFVATIYTNDITEYSSCYTAVVNNTEDNKHCHCIDDFISKIQKEFKPSNYNVAFITDNECFIEKLFDELKRRMKDSIFEDAIDVRCTSVNCTPVNRDMPRLVQQWVYSIWYGGTALHVKQNTSMNNNGFDNAMLKKLVSVKRDSGNSIVHHWIKPSRTTDLSECEDYFDLIYLDITSYYGSLVFSKDIEVIQFTSTPLSEIADKAKKSGDYSAFLNIVKNITTYW